MTIFTKHKNNSGGQLQNPITGIQADFTLKTGQGSLFPDVGVDNIFIAVIWSKDYQNPDSDPNREYIKAYRNSGDQFVIISRALENTTAKAWGVDSNLAIILTSGKMLEYETAINTLEENILDYILLTEKGANNGVATLDNSGKIPLDQIPASLQLNKGWWATPLALETAYPTGEAGWYALVGSTDTMWIWDTDTSAWLDTDTKGQVTSVNGQVGTVIITKSDVGLGNVDNTSDANKPLSIAEIAALQNKNAGMSQPPTFTNNNGTVTFSNFKCRLYSTSDFTGLINEYDILGDTFVLNDSDADINAKNYLVADYNGGNPILRLTTDVNEINESNILPVFSMYRTGNFVHPLSWDHQGNGLINRIHQKTVKLRRFEKEFGVILSETTGRVINISNGKVWYGGVYQDLLTAISDVDYCNLYASVAGVKTRSQITQYNNTQYDNGTDLATLTNGRYAVNYVWRGVEQANHIYVMLGQGDYTLAQAQASSIPTPPPIIAGHCIFVGRIIVQKGSSTATQIDNVTTVAFTTSGVTIHGDLAGRDSADQHPASSITKNVTAKITSNNVESAIEEVADEIFSITNVAVASAPTTIDLTAESDVYQRIVTSITSGVITVNLPLVAKVGKSFIIRLASASYTSNTSYISLKYNSVEICKIYCGAEKEVFYSDSGVIFKGVDGGSMTIGLNAKAQNSGIAIGPSAEATGSASLAMGSGGTPIASGTSSMALGKQARSSGNNSVAFFGNDNSKSTSFVKNENSYPERAGEEVFGWNASGSRTLYGNGIVHYSGATANSTEAEIYLLGTSFNRFICRASSSYMFSLKCIIRNNTTNDTSAIKIEGVIRRDGSNNTTFVGIPVKTILGTSDANLDVNVYADDTNEALAVKVKGHATNSTTFVAAMDFVEIQLA